MTVTDVDDELPHFERSWYRCDVDENQPGGTAVCAVSAVDDDLDPFNIFHYRLDASSDDRSKNDSGELREKSW